MTQRSTPRTLRNSTRPLAGLLTGAVAGLLAAAVALGVAQFVAGLTGADGVPVIAVGSAAIDLTPVPVKDFAIQHFGTHDKLVLLSGIVVVLAVFAAVTGVMAMRRRTYGLAGLAVFGAIGAAAVLTRPVARPADIVPTLVGVAAGALALLLLVRAAMGRTAIGRTAMGGPAMGSTSAGGWTCGTPVETVLDGRNALLAVGMNGQPLPIAHGFPARMLVPGLYGYASATKWVVDLEIATFAAQRSYWAQHGYAVRGPIKTESRIDVPKPLQQVKAGRTAVAGVAWAPHRGIDRVEVRADNGAWHDAKLATVPGIDTWRQWVWQWDATPGLHQLEVRATDGTGATQSARRVPIFPNGATGWDSTTVTVT
jgi:hypothetical protein